MILECRHCGAPLDVKPDAALTKCRYCDTTSERRLLRTVAAETPRDFRPPKQWVPPPHVPAASNQPLTYHSASPRAAVIGVLAAGVMMAVLGVTVAVSLRAPGSSKKGGGLVAAVLPGMT
ncbi:MAG TPA: hypothetical protein VM694_34995, partial [Polyangium sp.]|nr:hypothetical protein [Polyangium sp.]